MYAGLKLYDFIAWMNKKKEDMPVPSCYMMGRRATSRAFPQLNTKGLRGGIVYHDGSYIFTDAIEFIHHIHHT